MRFLANENFPGVSIRILRLEGHEVIAASEEMAGSIDDDVLAYARISRSILLTFDRDYGELIYRRRLPPPAGILYLRFDPAYPEEPALFLLQLMQESSIGLEGQFTTATREVIRQRALPSTHRTPESGTEER